MARHGVRDALRKKMAKNFRIAGLRGSYTARGAVRSYRAGDVLPARPVRTGGDVWIVVGSCSDGKCGGGVRCVAAGAYSFPGRRQGPEGANSEAVKLATYYMKKYCPAVSYKRYPNCAKGSSYLSHDAQMRWDVAGNEGHA